MRTLTLRRRAPRAGRPGRLRARAGFTIVEGLIAMLVLTTGVLALVSASTSMLTLMTNGNQRSIAASVTGARIERFRSINACAQLVALNGGTATTRRMQESWNVVANAGVGGQNAVDVTYRIRYQTGRAWRADTLVTRVPCE